MMASIPAAELEGTIHFTAGGLFSFLDEAEVEDPFSGGVTDGWKEVDPGHPFPFHWVPEKI